ncbi:hypothetical protein [Saccharothrix sp. HUAS TT1]|uniref:hypothetical protein n=1 Tax=unclassified Saccharothrix TaxID=2593673 RepID=UPI00345C29EB
MCEYPAIRGDDQPLPSSVVAEHLAALGLRQSEGRWSEGRWSAGDETGNLAVTPETAAGRCATAADDQVVGLDVALWCPHSSRTARWPDEATGRAQERLLDAVARALGWTIAASDR